MKTNDFKTIIICLSLLLFSSKAFAQKAIEGPGEMPKGKLTFFEYKTDYNHNFLYESFTAKRNPDGKVDVTVYDYYAKIDSITVDGNDEVMDYIYKVLEKNMKVQDLRGDITWLNGETGTGQTHHFVGIFDSGDTLRMNGYIWRHGFRDIEKYLVDYALAQKRVLKFVEIPGEIPENSQWHNGRTNFYYQKRSGTIEKRYQVCDKQIIVVTGARSKKVLDVYIEYNNRGDDIQDGLIELISGVYENEKGKSVFGKVEFQDGEERAYGDPGSDIKFVWNRDVYVYADSISWGSHRMQQRTYGGGNGGALSGPTYWRVKYIDEGLEVWEYETGMYAPTSPDFGKHFKLKRIRGPYKHTKDIWAIASEKPLTRGQLSRLTPKQREDMILEIKARHSDGSNLTDIEDLNIRLIEGMR